jgi:hypothetical protein
MGRPPYWKKNINDLDQIATRIQKLTLLVQGSPSSRFVNFPRRKIQALLCSQHMDDLFLASHYQEKCWETKALLA